MTTILQGGSHTSVPLRSAQSADAGKNDRPVTRVEAAFKSIEPPLSQKGGP